MKKIIFFILYFIPVSTFSQNFNEIDSLVLSALNNKVFPGCQLLIGNSEKVLYYNSFGHFTYDDTSPVVSNSSIFDIASLTKVIATTTAIMILEERKFLDVNDYVSKYIPDFSRNGKESVKIINLLLHNSGLKAWEPFYKFCNNKKELLQAIYEMPLQSSVGSKYIYSDLNFIILGEIIEIVSGETLDIFCFNNIFKPLGMRHTMFNPKDEYKTNSLPTEYDKYWRMKQLKGEVHDEASYLMNGISGNAGLFSNSEDIYILMRMLLNKGTFIVPDSKDFLIDTLIQPETIKRFLKVENVEGYHNTRMLGWDTKTFNGNSRFQCGELISDNCFGHTGYTGTSAWCDLDRKLIIILLSNRVFPNRNNNAIRDFRPEFYNYAIKILINFYNYN